MWKLIRLLSRDFGAPDIFTLDLGRAYIEIVLLSESLMSPWLLGFPPLRARVKLMSLLSQKKSRIAWSLLEKHHFKILLSQVFHIGTAQEERDLRACELYIEDVLCELDDTLRNLHRAAGPAHEFLFFATLWISSNSTGGVDQHRVSFLKERFMLKQFVDQISKDINRDTLLHEVYESISTIPPSRTSGALADSYKDLHEVVLRFSKDLEVMTGGALEIEMLSGDFSIRQYELWLFPYPPD